MIIVRTRILVIFAFLAIVLVSVGLFTQGYDEDFNVSLNAVNPEDMGVEERLEDFQFLYDIVKNNYPYLELKERTHGYNWIDLKEGYEGRIRKATNNEDFLNILWESVEALQNRHTGILSPEEVKEYHIQFQDSHPMNVIFCDEVAEAAEYWIEIYDKLIEKIYLTKYDTKIVYDRGNYILTDYYANPINENSKITKVNGTFIDEAIKTCFEKDYLDWDFLRNKTFLWRITPNKFGNDTEYTIMDSQGRETIVTFLPTYGSTRIYNLYPDAILNLTKLGKNIAYMYIGSFESSIMEPLYDEILMFYEDIADYGYLIIDIRGNTGGAFHPWIKGIVRPLIKTTKTHKYYLAYKTGEYIRQFHREFLKDKDPLPKDHFDHLPPETLGEDFEIYNFTQTYTPTEEANYNGEIILLTDRVVYSAAEGFTNFCKQTDFATIYGTSSGGDGFFIWPMYIVLPNSKIVITMTSSMSIDENGRSNEEWRTQPDIIYESHFGNFDELIRYVIKEIEK